MTYGGNGISIHAPLAGSDYYTIEESGFYEKISIHAPLAGSDSKTVQKADTCFVTNVHFAKLNSQGSI